MFLKLALLFIGFPMLELWILVELGSRIGVFTAVALVIGTGVLGAYLARMQGFLVWQKIHAELNAGQMPAEEMVDGILIFVAGIILLTPGLLTDIGGFLLLIPQSRFLIKRWLRSRFDRMMSEGNVNWRYLL